MNLRMKYTGKIALCGWGLSLLLTFAACSDEESNVTTQEGNATMTFRLSTRAEGDEATSTEQHTHLYVAERLSEHSGIDEDNPMGGTEIPLYCDKDFTIEGNSYSVTNLLGQWYKFAFVCVPDLEEVKGMGEDMLFKRYNATTQKNEDFNNYYVTFTGTKALASGNFTWEKAATDPVYMAVSGTEKLTATIHLVDKDNKIADSVEVSKEVTAGKAWKLTVTPKVKEGSIGITIEINGETNDYPIDIEIPSDWV